MSSILVIEDNRAGRKLVQDILARDGYQVVCAEDGKALEAGVDHYMPKPIRYRELLAVIERLLEFPR